MGFLMPKVPKPNTGAQTAELARQKAEADAAKKSEQERRTREEEAFRRKQRGRASLISTSELGVSDTFGGG